MVLQCVDAGEPHVPDVPHVGLEFDVLSVFLLVVVAQTVVDQVDCVYLAFHSDHKITRLQVPVDYPHRVKSFQSGKSHVSKHERGLQGKLTFAQPVKVIEVLVQQIHDQNRRLFILLVVVELRKPLLRLEPVQDRGLLVQGCLVLVQILNFGREQLFVRIEGLVALSQEYSSKGARIKELQNFVVLAHSLVDPELFEVLDVGLVHRFQCPNK